MVQAMTNSDKVTEIDRYLGSSYTMFRTAAAGYNLLVTPQPGNWKPGILIVATFGRSVTSCLQRLSSRVDGFEAWYAPFRQTMETDPLMGWFYKHRTETLKKGDMPDIPFQLEWDLTTGAGTHEYEFDPDSGTQTQSRVWIPDGPTLFLGQPKRDQDPLTYATHYLSYLEAMVLDAMRVFRPEVPRPAHFFSQQMTLEDDEELPAGWLLNSFDS